MLVTLKELLNQYLEKDAIVGAFNATSFFDAKPMITAAEKLNAPVIVEVSPLSAKIMDLGLWSNGRRIEDIKNAIDVGCPSVMYDGSQLSYEDNVTNTKEVVNYAHPKGVSVEAEIGSVAYTGNDSIKSILSDPETTANFVADTKIDADKVKYFI